MTNTVSIKVRVILGTMALALALVVSSSLAADDANAMRPDGCALYIDGLYYGIVAC
jgi:hypothetical protein